MALLAKSLRCLTVIWVILAAGACASVAGVRRPPSAADSLLALTLLNATIVSHTRHVLASSSETRLSLGARLDRLPNLYASTRRAESRYARQVQRDLEAIDYEALTQDDYLTLLAVHWDLAMQGEAAIYRALDFGAIVPGASPLPAIARSLSQHPLDAAEDVQRYFYLLDNVALFFAEVRANLAEQAKAGIRIPREALATIRTFLRGYSQPAEQSPFALAGSRLTRIDTASRAAVVAALTRRIEDEINVQVDSLLEYLAAADMTNASDSSAPVILGLRQYPGGGEYYRYLLRRRSTLDATPDDLYAYGVREVARISAAMTALRTALGFNGSDSSFRAALAAKAEHRVASPNEFEARVRLALGVMRDSARTRLGIAVADSMRFTARAARPLDGAQHVWLRESDAIDTTYRMEYVPEHVTRLPAFVIPALVARELVPGRLMLLSAVRWSDSLPTLRQLMRFEGPVDGWAEHGRGLAGELGLFSDSLVAYGALMLELETAARMVTDLGLHNFGWPQQEAVRYLREHSVDASLAEDDVLRIALAEPARAVAAKVGSRELAGQRAWVQRELGTQFDDGALQREILRVGVLPLPLLSRHLAWWTWKIKSTEPDARSK